MQQGERGLEDWQNEQPKSRGRGVPGDIGKQQHVGGVERECVRKRRLS
jgi:hypothetical protein